MESSNSSDSSVDFNLLLNDLRQSIDYLDTYFIFIIAERIRLIMRSIYFKRQQHLPLNYSDRRKQDLQKTIDIAIEHHLNEAFIRKLFNYIYQHATLMNEQKDAPLANELANLKIPSHILLIQDLQDSIYHLDVALCCLLAERYHLVKKVGSLKKIMQHPPLAANRWQKILTEKLTMAAALNLDVNFMKNMMEIIHEESLRIESEIIEKP